MRTFTIHAALSYKVHPTDFERTGITPGVKLAVGFCGQGKVVVIHAVEPDHVSTGMCNGSFIVLNPIAHSEAVGIAIERWIPQVSYGY